jgi:DNA repair photolyase
MLTTKCAQTGGTMATVNKQQNKVTKTAVMQDRSPDGSLVRQIVRKDNWGSAALTMQKVINAFNFPFTLNPGSGCFYRCAYCFLRQQFFDRHVDAPWSKEMNYKSGFVDKLVLDLKKYEALPQYMKRVQIPVATEMYHPKMIEYYQPRKILEAFRDHGPDWMIHLLTKSDRILDDADLIVEMKHQIQIEISLVTLDDEAFRRFETGTPHPKARLAIIEEFAQRGVFVRAMCMPVLRKIKLTQEGSMVLPVYRNTGTGEEVGLHRVGRANKGNGLRYFYVSNGRKKQINDLAQWKPVILEDYSRPHDMKSVVYNLGAKAFKSKDLNYYYVEELLDSQAEGRAPLEQKGRFEDPAVEMLEKSGEAVVDENGNPIQVEVGDYSVPKKKWTSGRPPPIKRPVMDYGYRDISPINWIDSV